MKSSKRKTRKKPKFKLPNYEEGAPSFEELLIFLYGPPKCGKTKFGAKIPGACFLQTEPGAKFQKVRPYKIQTWQKFLDTLDGLESIDLEDVSCFVVDTVDNLYKMCFKHMCTKLGIEHPSSTDFGKQWSLFGSEWAENIVRLGMLGKGVLFIGHAKSREKEIVKNGIKDTIQVLAPTLSGSPFHALNAYCDLILCVEQRTKKTRKGESTKPWVHTLPTANFEGGGKRLETLPEWIRFEYETFIEEYNESLEERNK